jgi:hypothetical protein
MFVLDLAGSSKNLYFRGEKDLYAIVDTLGHDSTRKLPEDSPELRPLIRVSKLDTREPEFYV